MIIIIIVIIINNNNKQEQVRLEKALACLIFAWLQQMLGNGMSYRLAILQVDPIRSRSS